MRATDRLLVAAIEMKDMNAVAKAIEAGADPNVRVGGCPVLVTAVAQGNTAAVERLLAAGADADAADDRGNTVLCLVAPMAITAGQLRSIDLLIKAGADVNARGPSGLSVIDGAASCLNRPVVQRLSDAGAKPIENVELVAEMLGSNRGMGR